ncbi:WD40 repeat domain-containing protein, partial [Rathayibacter sp. SD072]|uniref:WD40 repeat domain-containing protein n=1 Tax=Rathayibacter sp. SD072 TaxID=2781731 RepID=UPI001A95C4B7
MERWTRAERPSSLPAVVAALAVAVLLWPLTAEPATGGPVAFPRQVASYSWWTPMLEESEVGTATMLYQNGFGVEFLDLPQSVVLGADASTYRRLGAAEQRSTGADQGDPASSVLSADGSFVVISGPGRDGGVEIVDLDTDERRGLPIGDGRSAVALSIDSAGESVLLLTSDDEMSRYRDAQFLLNGDLAVLDLSTGEVRDLPLDGPVHSAALSPDGTVIAAETSDALVILDAGSGTVLTSRAPVGGGLDGDAFSPDGRRLAVPEAEGLRVLEWTGTAEDRLLPLPADSWSSAVGWRDDGTVLLHVSDSDGGNGSTFAWADVASGELDVFSRYSADAFTGAALGSADVARDLIAEWAVVESRRWSG